MGLRINTNANALSALRNLHNSDRMQRRSLERLSTGLRITRASDDPAGMVISEQLRSQISGLKQAVENTTFSNNLINTSEAALVEVSNLLSDIRKSIVFSLNTGGTSQDQISAEQDAVDAAIGSVDRIAATTRFGNTHLLNGASGFTSTNVASQISDMYVRSVFFLNTVSSLTFTAIVTTSAQQGMLSLSNNGSGATVVRVTGLLGTEDITLQSGATTATVVGAINAVRSFTGVWASGATAFTEDYGSVKYISIKQISGNYSGTTGTDYGEDVIATVNGTPLDAEGNTIHVNSPSIEAELTFTNSVVAGGASYTFDVLKSGLTFQLSGNYTGADQYTIGVRSIDSHLLGKASYAAGASGGTIGGYLSSLVRGGSNDLTTNPSNALRIVTEAIDQVSALRGFLGAISERTLQPNANSLSVALENLTSSESTIRDLDFAAETAEFTRTQVLFAAGTSVLASANLIPQTILTLLRA